ncbi:hypothetical protein M8J76_010094 [Diaphorina citri]|nr:hypothetical protein M8J75_001281 [Diaphorina citri]KAI5726870.1 hypothetical protein M8J76_010094 [Diaphorina citri]
MLKGILYGAALINSQLPDQGPSGRNEVEYWLSDPEILLLLSYILLENEESTNMLQVACCHPRKTQQYLNIAKMVVKIRNVFVYGKPVETDYSKKFIEVQKAIDIGLGERTACASLCMNM